MIERKDEAREVMGEDQSKSASRKESSIAARATRGTLWTILSHGGGQFIRFASNLILTRLLFEEAFGLMALVHIFLMGLALFSDVGIGPSIIQNKRGDEPAFLNTAWTIQVVRGVVLWLIACAGAYPMSILYDQPMLVSMIPIAGLTSLVLGFSSTRLFALNRKLYVGRIAILELTSQVTGIVVMIIWALIDRSVWALVVGALTTDMVKSVLSHVALPGIRNRFHWNRDDARSLFRFGKWIFVSTVGMFLANQSDRLIFAKLIPIASLGVYHIGFTLANMPAKVLNRVSYRIIFPLFSRTHQAGGDLPTTFKRVRWPMLALAGWVLSGFIAGGSTIVDLLYDDRYLGAGWIVQMVAIGCWFALIEVVYGAALLATGRSGWVAAATMTKFVAMVILIPTGYYLFHFPGAVTGMVASDGFRMMVAYIAAPRAGLRGWPGELALSAVVVVAAVAGYLVDAGVALANGHVVLRAIAVFVSVSLVWLPIGIGIVRRFKREGSPLR